MSEEEKKAIEILSKEDTAYFYRYVDVREAVSTILNLIQKQEKIIDYAIEEIHNMDTVICDRMFSIVPIPINNAVYEMPEE